MTNEELQAIRGRINEYRVKNHYSDMFSLLTHIDALAQKEQADALAIRERWQEMQAKIDSLTQMLDDVLVREDREKEEAQARAAALTAERDEAKKTAAYACSRLYVLQAKCNRLLSEARDVIELTGPDCHPALRAAVKACEKEHRQEGEQNPRPGTPGVE